VVNPANAQQHGIRGVPDLLRHAKAHPGQLNMASSDMTSAEFARHIAAQTKKWAEVVRVSGAKVD